MTGLLDPATLEVTVTGSEGLSLILMTRLSLEQLIGMNVNANETRLRYALFHGAVLGASLLGIGLLLPILGVRTISWPLLLGGPLTVGVIHASLIYTGIAPRGP